MSDDYLMDIRAVVERVSLSRSGIYGMVKIGVFPKPEKIGAKAVRWRSSVIQQWIEGLAESVG